MSLKAINKAVQEFFEEFAVSPAERSVISEYIEAGKNLKKIESDCKSRTVDFKRLASVCKPVFSELAEMRLESEEFGAAYRFWEYLVLRIDYEADYEGRTDNFMLYLQDFTSCKLTVKEALLIMTVKTDYKRYRPESVFNYSHYWTRNGDYCRGKLFAELYETLFALKPEEITYNFRWHVYFRELQAAALKGRNFTVRSMNDVLDCVEKIKIARAVPETDYTIKNAQWFNDIGEAVYGCYSTYLALLKKGDKSIKTALLESGDKYFTYSDQFRVFNSSGAVSVNEAFDALIGEADIRKKLFSRENIARCDDYMTFERFNTVAETYPDRQMIFDGLCFSPNKKVCAYCKNKIDGDKEYAAAFKSFAQSADMPKYNAAQVAALFEKWKDEESSGAGFASLAEVEAYAEKQKLNCARILEKFDYSAKVYGKDKTTPVSEKTLKVFLDKYFSMKDIYRNHTCDNMAAHFDKASFGAFLDGIYYTWEASDYDNKLKAAVVPYCFYASNDKLANLKKQCVTFCDAGRHALTAYIIRTIALNGGKYALMLVDGISNKFPYPKAKQVAKNSMAEAAKKYKIPVEILADMIIPTCGFASDGTRGLYADVKLTLLPEGGVRINRGDKILKSLPSDADEESKKELSGIKKDLKAIIKMQTVRIERAFTFGRCWTYKNFVNSYLKHPVMRLLITNFVWGTYTRSGDLEKTFRIGMDGAAETCGYEEAALADGDIIALVHPCDLSEEQIAEWQTYIADNEIKQPFAQIGARVCRPLKIDEKEKCVDLKQYAFNYSHLQRLAKKYDMQRTESLDGGAFDGYFLEDAESGLGVEVDMEEIYFGAEPTDGKNLTVRFYLLTGKDGYTPLNPADVPTRLVSCILSSLAAFMPEMQTAASGKTVKNAFNPYDAGEVDLEN